MVRLLKRRGETGGWRRRCWAMRRVGKRTKGVHLEVADLNELRRPGKVAAGTAR